MIISENNEVISLSHKIELYPNLKVPNPGYVKLSERLRFKGKINSVTISQPGDKFYASFSVSVDKKDDQAQPKTHLSLGIDAGLKSFVSLSNGLEIKVSKPSAILTRQVIKQSRPLSKKQHPKTKGDKTK